LEAGDTITVTMGDDKTHTYTVIAKKAIPKDAVDMTEALTPIQLDKPGLNLMTCYGTFDSKEKTYDQRLLVYASLQ
jgi:sortase (surface protein transpeptidase)